MRKLTTSIGSALLGLGLAVGAGAAPAMAATQGPAGYITFWDGCDKGGVGAGSVAGYCGAAWPLAPTSVYTCYSVPTGSNDVWSAFSNRSGHNVNVYTAGGCGGSVATLYNGTETGNLASPFNNSISSYRRIN